MIKQLKAGDRVIAVRDYRFVKKGMQGTYLYKNPNIGPTEGIEWAELTEGHTCAGNCKIGKGYYVNPEDIELLEEYQAPIYNPICEDFKPGEKIIRYDGREEVFKGWGVCQWIAPLGVERVCIHNCKGTIITDTYFGCHCCDRGFYYRKAKQEEKTIGSISSSATYTVLVNPQFSVYTRGYIVAIGNTPKPKRRKLIKLTYEG